MLATGGAGVCHIRYDEDGKLVEERDEKYVLRECDTTHKQVAFVVYCLLFVECLGCIICFVSASSLIARG